MKSDYRKIKKIKTNVKLEKIKIDIKLIANIVTYK
jgi:hypothetical protein